MHRRALLLTLGVTAAAVLGAIPAGAAPLGDHVARVTRVTQPAPAGLLKAALANASAASGVHYVWTTIYPDHSYVDAGDISKSAGEQTISIVVGSKLGTATERLVNGQAYLEANAFALSYYFGFPTKVATTYGGKWIEFKASDGLYASIVQGMTVSSLVNSITLAAPLSIAKEAVVDGLASYGVTGQLVESSGTGQANPLATMAIAAKAEVPVAEYPSSPSTPSWRYDFAKWGEAIKVVGPPKPVLASSIAGISQPHVRLGWPTR